MTERDKLMEEIREKLKTHKWDKSTWIVMPTSVHRCGECGRLHETIRN